jgi:hypothetical protein
VSEVRPALGVAETGFFARLDADPDSVALIGKDETERVRVAPGAWEDTQQPGDYPRIAYYGMERPWGKATRGVVLLTVDIYAWPDTEDPEGTLDSIDGALLRLFAERYWRHEGRRLAAVDLGAQSWPTSPGRAIRRTRTLRVFVS